MNIPPGIRRLLVILSIVLLGLLAFIGYYASRLTQNVDIIGIDPINTVDAKEARRKLKLFDSALQAGSTGFIRLSEVEINSHLHELLTGSFSTNSTPLPEAGPTQRIRVDLQESQLSLYCWVKSKWMLRTWNVVWERTGTFHHTSQGWEFNISSMRVGKVNIPRNYWPYVTKTLSSADQILAQQSAWFQKLPAISLRVFQSGKRPELRLYTYPETNALSHASQ